MANWHPDSSKRISQRFVITGQLFLETPASFSSGEISGTELVILEDALENRPLLPGASLAGALRHYLITRVDGYRTDQVSELATTLFGLALDDGTERMESRVIVNDALGQGRLTRREGVKIAGATRTADEGMLFTSQVWEAGTSFELRFELVIYEDDEEPERLIGAFAAALEALRDGKIPLGGRKHRGYGRVLVDRWFVSDYDLTNPAALSAWLLDKPHSDGQQFFELASILDDKRQYIRIEAGLNVCDSILIRAESDVAEKEHLTSLEWSAEAETYLPAPVLSGTSLAGALRARAMQIARTVNPAYAVSIVDDLFGKHGKARDGEEQLTASRVHVEEHPIHGGTFEYIQSRVKIDRFTGGAFETALFSERPLFADDNTRVQVNLELHYPADKHDHALLDAQTGLLLLVLKDLWTEDLPLGGEASVGRGRLKGESACIYFKFEDDNEPIVVALDEQGLSDAQHVSNIQSYVKALWDYDPEVQS